MGKLIIAEFKDNETRPFDEIMEAGYVNRMAGVVRGRRPVTASYSILSVWTTYGKHRVSGNFKYLRICWQ